MREYIAVLIHRIEIENHAIHYGICYSAAAKLTMPARYIELRAKKLLPTAPDGVLKGQEHPLLFFTNGKQ